MLVRDSDALGVDWSLSPHPSLSAPRVEGTRPLHLAWITSPPGSESGGHQNIWRFVEQAERAGHTCSIHLYDASGVAPTPHDIEAMLSKSSAFAKVSAPVSMWDSLAGVGSGVDAILATGWETAYASYLDPSLARRLYFVQDFEPLFYPVGSQSILAENTYRFGFHGVTAGKWLAHEVSTKFGMTADSFDFAADTSRYTATNEDDRKGVFFYARPVTSRRAFELGTLALEAFHKARPEATIHLAGWPISPSSVRFPHTSHGSLPLDRLNALYNECAAGLVLSLTNLSLLPLELLAAGVTPVINDAPNNRMVSDNSRFAWTPTSPAAIARTLVDAYDANDRGQRVRANVAGVPRHTWNDSGVQFVGAVERAVRA